MPTEKPHEIPSAVPEPHELGQIFDALACAVVVEAGGNHQELVAAVSNDVIVGPE